MTEYDNEPIPGLPGIPPAGERILWQGSPSWRVLARTAFHTRLIAGYFALLVAWAGINAVAHSMRSPGNFVGVEITLTLGIVGVGLLHVLAWASARTTIYTLTNRRVVLRIGIAVPKCINLPLAQIGAIDLADHKDGSGDLPLTTTGPRKLGYLALWPHARPLRIVSPQPMLRAVPDAQRVAMLIAGSCLVAHPEGVAHAEMGMHGAASLNVAAAA